MLKITLSLNEQEHYKDWDLPSIVENVYHILRGILYSRLEDKSNELLRGSEIKGDPRLELIHKESLRIYEEEIKIANELLKNVSIEQI